MTGHGFTEDESPFSSITACAWFATVACATVGYGDLIPITPGGRIITSIAMLSGTLVIALPVTVVGSTFHNIYTSMSAAVTTPTRLQEDAEVAHAAHLCGGMPLARSLTAVRRARLRDCTLRPNQGDGAPGSLDKKVSSGDHKRRPRTPTAKRRSKESTLPHVECLRTASIAAPLTTMMGLTAFSSADYQARSCTVCWDVPCVA
jgi:Ion channel